MTAATGDLDGDGAVDTFTVYRDGVDWHIHVQFGFGFGIQTPFDPYNPGGTPAAEAVMDVGSPAELGLVMTGFALPGPVFGVWAVIDCELQRSTLDGGEFLPYRGLGPVHSEGFTCTADGMAMRFASQPGSDPSVWQVEEHPYLWVPGLGDFQSQAVSTVVTNQATALAMAAEFDC